MTTSKNLRQGYFKPRNPKKYRGNPTNIFYRSGWEMKCMVFFDSHPDIISWSSEEIVIPYKAPDGRIRRYFPDFFIEKKLPNGTIVKEIIEVKPKKQTKQPKKRKNQTNDAFLAEAQTYGINISKWEAAEQYCKKRGMSFRIMTEHDILGIPLKTKGLKTKIKI